MTTRTSHVVCSVEDLPPGTRRIVDVEGTSIGNFNVGGKLYAIRNTCPHKGAPLCKGTIGGTMLPSEPHTYVYGMKDRLLRCPWHGWEIDLETGRPALTGAAVQVRTYVIAARDGQVVIER
jgi:3-phenylpropionate/trans-cinnamate dioxygenase ferredoxin subunit